MGTIHSDKAWNAYGKKNPYFGVLTHEQFMDENLTEENLRHFFETGEKHVQSVFDRIEKHLILDFKPKSSLDFGCGTGRLSLALAKRSSRVIGLDVSADMLKEAKKNGEKYGLNNVEFRLSDDSLSQIDGEAFDFINSYIVLQHINVERGMKIIDKMLGLLNPGGIGALQITYSSNKLKTNKIATYFRYRIPLVHKALNGLRGVPLSTPLMQMNLYSMNSVLHLLQQNGVQNTQLQFEDHGDYWSAHMIFQKMAL
jgi:2-polyprenyl-3-methyl-5-hydroxy-6-metoxy-1,4-benzoquinol methylase